MRLKTRKINSKNTSSVIITLHLIIDFLIRTYFIVVSYFADYHSATLSFVDFSSLDVLLELLGCKPLVREDKRRDLLVSVASEPGHPSHIGVDIVSSAHVHDLTDIFLSVLILELLGEALICGLQEGVSLSILVLRRECLVSS